MSLNPYRQSMLAADLNIKTFVKESGVVSKKNDKHERRELNFNGDEARVAYEEIVNNKTDNVATRYRSNRKKSFTSEKLKAVTRSRDRSRDSRKQNVKVTANSILKAVERGDIDYLKENLRTSNVNVCDDYGWTPLMSAAFCGNYKIVDFLLKLGANTRCRDKSGFTAGGLASKKNYSGIVALLKEKHFHPESNNQELSRIPNPKKESETNVRKSKFYCSVCRETFRETTVEKHEASTLHIFNEKPKLPAPVYAIPRENKGHQILLKKGWKGEGLGPDGEGSKYPIKTILKRDRRGLGQEKSEGPRITHFSSGDARAIATVRREPRERILRRRDREKLLNREARRERAIRKALS